MADILFVLTSHTELGETGTKTGFHFTEMSKPFYILQDAGHTITLASVAGGRPEADPSSLPEDAGERPEDVQRFLADADAMAMLETTKKLSEVSGHRYDGVYLPGGHGTMWDFPDNAELAALIGRTIDTGGIVGAVCHGPAGLLDAKRADGRYVVEGLRVNSFTDEEERAMGLAETVPFLLESRLRTLGAQFEGGAQFTEMALRDGQLITGQNPMSAAKVARLMDEALTDKDRAAA